MKEYNLEGYGIVKVYPMPWVMKPFAIAFVWNKKVRCSASHPSQRLIRHEMIHVLQQQEIEKDIVEKYTKKYGTKYGEKIGKALAFPKFLWLYVKLWLTTGLSYYRHPMEKDAREYQNQENFIAIRPRESWRGYI